MQRAIADLVAQWNLTLEPRFALTPGSPGNFVAPATRADGTRCVLKVSEYLRETQAEIAALAFWGGRGAARLLAADPERGALLLERIEPGAMLADTVQDDDEATRIAAGVLRELWQPAGARDGLRSLDSWCDAYERNRERLSRDGHGFPADLFNRADALRAELLASARHAVALHGDLHHFNLLWSAQSGWLAIDPKGLYGDCHFDVCQFLRNPEPMSPHVNRRRLDVFAAELGLDRRRLRDWCVVHAVLDAVWSFEDGGRWQARVNYAEETLAY